MNLTGNLFCESVLWINLEEIKNCQKLPSLVIVNNKQIS